MNFENSIYNAANAQQENQVAAQLLHEEAFGSASSSQTIEQKLNSALPTQEASGTGVSTVAIDVRDGRFSRIKNDTEFALKETPLLTPLKLADMVNDQLRRLGSNRFLKDRADYPGPTPGSRWSVMEVDQFRHRDRRIEKLYEYRINWSLKS